MKKYFFSTALMLLVCGLSAACNDDDTGGHKTPAIEIDTEDLTQEFSRETQTRFVSVVHSKLFDLRSSDDSWLTVKRTGNGLQINGINITVAENTLAAERTAEVTIWTEDVETIKITVTQSGAEAVLSAAEQSVLVKNTLSFNLNVTANMDVVFDLPTWITQDNEVTGQGTHSFTATALENDTPRSGEIVIRAENVQGVTPVTIPVKQEPMAEIILPNLPTIPAPQFSAKWLDLFFINGGYRNTPSNTATESPSRIELRTGSNTPPSVWNSSIRSYVASYPAATHDTYYVAMYDERLTTDIDAGTGAIQNGFTLETYLKVSDISASRIRPFATINVHGGLGIDNVGIGFQIVDGQAEFICANMNNQIQHLPIGAAWDTNKFYHIMAVYTGSQKPDNKVTLYVDGEEVGHTGALGDWTSLSWDDYYRGIGIGGNFAKLVWNGIEPGGMLHDGMIGEIAFFRWSTDEMTAQGVATRYAAVTSRASLTAFDQLKTMIETTLPAKATSGVTNEVRKAIEEAIELGWSLMGNFETTQSTVNDYLDYAAQLLELE